MSIALSKDTRRRIQKHLAHLGSTDEAIAQKAERRLIWFGRKAVEQVLPATFSPDPKVRFRAVWVLGKSQDERTLPAILRLTDDPDKRVRYDAVLALGESGHPQAVSALQAIRQRTSDPAQVASAAESALAKLAAWAEPGAA